MHNCKPTFANDCTLELILSTYLWETMFGVDHCYFLCIDKGNNKEK